MTATAPLIEATHTLSLRDGAAVQYRACAPPEPIGTVVLLHGLASNLTRWSEFVAHTSLAQRFALLRPNLRGHGSPPWRGRLSLEQWTEDLAALLDAERCERALLVGHSLGAHVAAHFAAHAPKRVAGLVLIDPVAAEALHGTSRWLWHLRAFVRLAAFTVRGLNALGLCRKSIPPRDLEALDAQTRQALAAHGDRSAIVAHYSSPLADLSHFPTANYLQELAELVRPLPLATLDMPVLVLLSRGITFTDPEDTRALFSRLPHAAIEQIDAYHWPLTERPDEVRAAIERFCKTVAADQGPAFSR